MPFGEDFIVLSDDIDEIEEGLVVNLHVGDKHEFEGLEGADDVEHGWMAVSEEMDCLIPEHCHLLL